jgi:hypothetical protein
MHTQHVMRTYATCDALPPRLADSKTLSQALFELRAGRVRHPRTYALVLELDSHEDAPRPRITLSATILCAASAGTEQERTQRSFTKKSIRHALIGPLVCQRRAGQIFIRVPARAIGASRELTLMLDPGTDCSIMPPQILNSLPGAHLVPLKQKDPTRLRMANGSLTPVLGRAAVRQHPDQARIPDRGPHGWSHARRQLLW